MLFHGTAVLVAQSISPPTHHDFNPVWTPLGVIASDGEPNLLSRVESALLGQRIMPSTHLMIRSDALTGPYRSIDARLASVIDVSDVVGFLLSVKIMISYIFVRK